MNIQHKVVSFNEYLGVTLDEMMKTHIAEPALTVEYSEDGYSTELHGK